MDKEPELDARSKIAEIVASYRSEPAKPTVPSDKTTDSGSPDVTGEIKPDKPSFFVVAKDKVGDFFQSAREWIVSLWKKIAALFASLVAKKKSTDTPRETKEKTGANVSEFVQKNKAHIILGAVGAVVIFALAFIFIRFEVVTVSQGIETSLGSAENRTVVITRSGEANINDLVVTTLPGATSEGQSAPLLMGSVFSKNDQTYAIYDGEVIWQIPLTDIRGIVMFAQPTVSP